ncbi:Piezo-type mechanosensitive ion channel-like protein [Raphanus sativus]|uniref:Piezo-type mechanosensitive ion channel homolog isoform X1 n=2 Tax=Raphanus sativus TaxID=3726 RepID=A0A6J0JWW9_RAPSA|nr:piezo-type mechanosensitive ion channel homolog isoform X1 [Raphanus sativus]XP_018439183.1 piezo-type mechanosensitive ion channel homolog isoform X1 [Raphanus sativus]KAJ4892562.1 Piezo-type mechanosensitive ion channel-like protein [Raphanus sativus]
MASFLLGFLLPSLLLAAALINWSLISFVDLIAFLLLHYIAPEIGYRFQRSHCLLWPLFFFSCVIIVSQVVYLFIWDSLGPDWDTSDTGWITLTGFMILKSWRNPTVMYFLALQLLASLVSLAYIYTSRFGFLPWPYTCWSHFSHVFEHLGSHLRVASCLFLPAVQLAVGICNPSWMSLPFFIGSCAGLVDWSLTSNVSGLFRWWRVLYIYSGFNIVLLYLYQLPINFSDMIRWIASFIGLFRISAETEGPDICSGLFLLLFFIMLSYVRSDLEDMDFFMSTSENNLAERLLPPKYSFFIRESRAGVRHTNVLLRGSVFKTFSINFFTYGFPVSLFALSFWSFHFASLCAFGLLAYVCYIIYAFPSLFRLHRLNGLLLVFILFWAVSTYIFNVAFSFLNTKVGKDMKIWEMVGLWHYTIPGFFLLAQFGLGMLVALGNLVNNSVFLYLSEESSRSSNDRSYAEADEETKVLVVATIAWGLRKCSRAIMLALIFLIAMKPGFVHAVYVVFFLIYLLSHNINRKIRKSLILLCEVHFALLYILEIDLVSNSLKRQGSVSREILFQLGLLRSESSWDFLEIALLACFCAIHNHGFEVLFSFSAIVRHTPSPPIGFSILKAGLNKSVLLSVYSSPSSSYSQDNTTYERHIASFLSAIGQKFLSMYRSCGTYIAFITILISVYLVKPNYVSFGYIFLLLLWITGRQLFEETKRRLWFPLKVYAFSVFMFIYCLSSFVSLQLWLSGYIDLYFFLGYNSKAPLLDNVWESLAVLVVMQLYSYERRQSGHYIPGQSSLLHPGVFGFVERFLVWHGQKILFAALFYASLSPISVFGFVYLLGLVICTTFPKSSSVPSKLFLIYTGFLVSAEYLFQLWGMQAQMFPGQKYAELSFYLGLRVYEPGFWGIESGLRGKVLVVAACTLQYNVFRWLERTPGLTIIKGKYDEPCPLFVSAEDTTASVSGYNGENLPSTDHSSLSMKQGEVTGNSWPFFSARDNQAAGFLHPKTRGSESGSSRKFSFGHLTHFWGSIKESHRWNRRRILALKKERFETQKNLLKIYLKFSIENMFNLYGLEINMIALLLASFALLNAISLVYIALLAACVLLRRRLIQKLWPVVVFLFASILSVEYVATWNNLLPSDQAPSETSVHCHDCWSIAVLNFKFCRDCWLGVRVDDPRTLISYFVVFMFACFKLRSDHISSFSQSSTYHQMKSQRKNSFVWRDLSFETKSMWTVLDYLRLYCYIHLLDVVLILILITGTLEYDILHLGYLAFALVFARMRLEILKKKNKIFRFLRVYNFVLIILSLAYQSPFVGNFNDGKCETVDYIYEVIGFYKYDYGFRITARSALVEIIIFMLVSLQSYMFSSQEFDYVSRYLEAEQIGAIVREQEKKAARKTEQLQQIREAVEKKRQRNLQVEKMKSEMLNLRVQLHRMSSESNFGLTSPRTEGLRRRRNPYFIPDSGAASPEIDGVVHRKEEQPIVEDPRYPFEAHELPLSTTPDAPDSPECLFGASPCEITEVQQDLEVMPMEHERKEKSEGKDNPLISAVQLIGDGVSQVQFIGNQAVNNLVNFLNISPENSDTNEQSSVDDEVYDEMESQKRKHKPFERSTSLQSDRSSDGASFQIGRILRHIWSRMQSNNDIVCYCCFIIAFLWNFSLLSMVYLAALFLYALCVHTGPTHIFWVLMLMYTEIYILLQYLYQIIIQHCGLSIDAPLLHELGFPTQRIKSSFVVSSLPLFLIYIFTLIQSAITVKDGDWVPSGDFTSRRNARGSQKDLARSSWSKRILNVCKKLRDGATLVMRGICRYWISLTRGAESPPYFVQVTMDVHMWPEDGIQPERVECRMNQLIRLVHNERCEKENPDLCPYSSRVHVQSIERSTETPNEALVVLEVEYASPRNGCCSAEWYKSLTPASDVAKEIRKAQHSGLVEGTGFPYPILSVIGGGKRETDLYAYIFGADLMAFFLVAIFYQSVIKNKSEFIDVYQLEDQFPVDFVIILMVIFFLIVVDRVIYLCSFATGKVVYYLFSLILFTYAVTEYAWSIYPTQQHAAGLALRFIFLAKAMSLALQAIQIRYGLPHKSTLYRQFLTSEVSRINYYGYRLYRALPFLYELRCVLDWSCTATSLTMYDWLKLEDVNASLYLVKCDTVLNRATHKHGERQTKMTKCCNGICLFFILLCVIWAPMLMYSSGNPTNIANPIKDASVQIDIKTVGGKLTLFQTTLCKRISGDNIDLGLDLGSQSFLPTYNKNDIQLICCQADASVLWLVPDTIVTRFVQSLDWDTDMDISFSWVLNRDRPKGKETVKYERSVDPQDLPKRSDVQMVLNGSMDGFRVHNLYPKFFRVTGSGDVRSFEDQEDEVSADIVMNHADSKWWWSFHNLKASENISACEGMDGPVAIIMSEETPPQGFLGDTLSKFSIWGLYITFVLAVGRFIRLQCSDLRMRIPYENLPSCDRLIAICEDLYAARAEGELGVEEVLYWTLVKIYRSPHMLLEYTKLDYDA